MNSPKTGFISLKELKPKKNNLVPLLLILMWHRCTTGMLCWASIIVHAPYTSPLAPF